MADKVLFDNGTHRNILLEIAAAPAWRCKRTSTSSCTMARPCCSILAGTRSIPKFCRRPSRRLAAAGCATCLSHQDPDIVAAVNGWLMTTDATAYISALWQRFVPHFGLDHLLEDRLLAIPDEGMTFEMGGKSLFALPAHFLHSVGNFQLYDPVAKILYTGDLGASLGMEYFEVTDFEAHLKYMEGFHRRYMTSNRAISAWAGMVRNLDIDIIAPQHGALFRGKPMVEKFIDWCASLDCGIDLITPLYKVPAAAQSAAPAR